MHASVLVLGQYYLSTALTRFLQAAVVHKAETTNCSGCSSSLLPSKNRPISLGPRTVLCQGILDLGNYKGPACFESCVRKHCRSQQWHT